MKKVLVSIVFAAFYLTAYTQISPSVAAKETTFTLHLTDLESATNTVYVGFYLLENKFPKQGQHAFRKVIKPNQTTVTQSWNDIPVGEYAIAVYQDLDENEKLATNLFGLPKEPYGFSTNFVAGMFSIPTFEKCKINISEANSKHTISLIR